MTLYHVKAFVVMANQEKDSKGENNSTPDEIIGFVIGLGISFILLVLIVAWIRQKAVSAGIESQPLPWMW